MPSLRVTPAFLLIGLAAGATVATLGSGACEDEGERGGDAVVDSGAPGAGGTPDATPADPAAGRVARENALPGTTAWQLDRPALAGEIEAYAKTLSAAAGATIEVAVSTRARTTYRWWAFRTGHYGGAGGRLVAEGGPLDGWPQRAPVVESTTGLVEARWDTSFSIATRDADGETWPSGVYLVKLREAGGAETYAIFVLRDDTRDAEVLVQLPTATWQAYNAWGGASLYVSRIGGLPRARKVSYDRPFEAALGHGAGTYVSKELPLVRWLEAGGYDVEYATNLDVGGPAGRIGAHRLLVAVGHDEYYTLEALERLGAAAESGVNLAFLTGNTAYWQVRYEDSAAGPSRTQVCYKEAVTEDPRFGVDDVHVSTRFRDPPVNRPENALLGVMSDGKAITGGVPWIVVDGSHWLYAGTGLKTGDAIDGLVGFEWDGLWDNGHTPSGLRVLADSPVVGQSRHAATIHTRGRGFVFAAGTIYFAQRLDDARVARMLENVLSQAGAKKYAP